MRESDVKADKRRPRRGRPALFAAIHRRHPFWGPVIWLLDHIWHFIWYLWGLLIIGGLAISPLVNFFISGSFGPDPRQWYISRLIEANLTQTVIVLVVLVALTTLAGIAHRLAHAQSRQLPRVRDLDPDAYVPKYIEDVYLTRLAPDTGADLDALAREALQRAGRRPDPTDPLAAGRLRLWPHHARQNATGVGGAARDAPRLALHQVAAWLQPGLRLERG